MGKTNNNQQYPASGSGRQTPPKLRISDYRSARPLRTLTITERAQQRLRSWASGLKDSQRAELAASPGWEHLASGDLSSVLIQRLRQMVVDQEHYSAQQISEILIALPPEIADSKRLIQLWGAWRCRYFAQQLTTPEALHVAMLDDQQKESLLQRLVASEQALLAGQEVEYQQLIEQLDEDIADYDDQIEACYQPEGPDSTIQSWPWEGMQDCSEALLETLRAEEASLLADNDRYSFSAFFSRLLLHPSKSVNEDSPERRLLIDQRRRWSQAEQQQLVQLLTALN